ncbi:MAG TPA: hypothetical protein ENF33_05395 [Nitrososphaeria archaeon]|nr:hypothetical protein [Nitrososphaeria archaeon]
MSLRSELENALKEFMNATGGDLVGCALARSDGLLLASTPLGGVDERKMAAISVTAAGVAKRLCEELNRGTPLRMMVEGRGGNILIANVGEDLFLIALTSEKPNLGLVFLEMERITETLATISKRSGK